LALLVQTLPLQQPAFACSLTLPRINLSIPRILLHVFLVVSTAGRRATGTMLAILACDATLPINGCCMSLERMISVGILGWLVVGFLLMGFNVW
jgi:hypothetical protein